MFQIAAPILEKEFMASNYTIEKLQMDNILFLYYPYDHHATDGHFIHSNRPVGSFGEVMCYFSAKHHLYDMKVEALVLPNWQACNWNNKEDSSRDGCG